MPAPINRAPQGLLGFLDIKNLGRNPSPLSDGLAATLDLEQWYLQTASRWVTQGNFNTIGPAFGYYRFFVGAVDLKVPSGEWWYVEEFSVNTLLSPSAAPVSAGCDDAMLTLTYELPMPTLAGGGSVGAAMALPTATTHAFGLATIPPKPQFALAEPRWLPPGTLFGCHLDNIAPIAGELLVAATVRYTPLRI